jgi:hypothetical protein
LKAEKLTKQNKKRREYIPASSRSYRIRKGNTVVIPKVMKKIDPLSSRRGARGEAGKTSN